MAACSLNQSPTFASVLAAFVSLFATLSQSSTSVFISAVISLSLAIFLIFFVSLSIRHSVCNDLFYVLCIIIALRPLCQSATTLLSHWSVLGELCYCKYCNWSLSFFANLSSSSAPLNCWSVNSRKWRRGKFHCCRQLTSKVFLANRGKVCAC